MIVPWQILKKLKNILCNKSWLYLRLLVQIQWASTVIHTAGLGIPTCWNSFKLAHTANLTKDYRSTPSLRDCAVINFSSNTYQSHFSATYDMLEGALALFFLPGPYPGTATTLNIPACEPYTYKHASTCHREHAIATLGIPAWEQLHTPIDIHPHYHNGHETPHWVFQYVNNCTHKHASTLS